MKTIVIQITVPDGVTVAVAQSSAANMPADGLDDFENEPLPPAPNEPVAFRGAAVQQPVYAEGCPVHRTAWKTVPAGISKKTGKPYEAFRACSEMGCGEKPR